MKNLEGEKTIGKIFFLLISLIAEEKIGACQNKFATI